jgi:hypothetical protein
MEISSVSAKDTVSYILCPINSPFARSDHTDLDALVLKSSPLTSFFCAKMTENRTFMVGDYTVGIICTLDKELLGVRCLLNTAHARLPLARRDTNAYTLGTMGVHAIVATCLPAGWYGTKAAASVASQMCVGFLAVEFCLLVGVAGGVPGKEEIRLGTAL